MSITKHAFILGRG